MYIPAPAIKMSLSDLISTVISNPWVSRCLPRIHITSLEQSMAHLPSTADQYKMPHCHSQYYGKWQLWTNYEQFHGWAPLASWQYSSYDIFGTGSLATHLPYCLCLAHSLTLTYLDVPFSQLQRIGQGRKIDLFRDLCEPEYNCVYACLFKYVWMCMCVHNMCGGTVLLYMCAHWCEYTSAFKNVCLSICLQITVFCKGNVHNDWQT